MTNRSVFEKQEQVNREARLANHLAASIELLTNKHVRGGVYRALQAPAATSYTAEPKANGRRTYQGPGKGYQVSFNPFHLADLATWLGAAWHEMGHIAWTPFDMDITPTLNLLEDARIEMLLLLKWPKTKGALLATLRHMLDGTGTALDTYAWVAGRNHLDPDLRARLRKDVVTSKADEIDRIFREYLSMGSDFKRDEAIRLAKELQAVLGGGATDSRGSKCNGPLSNSATPPPGEDDATPVPVSPDEVSQAIEDLANATGSSKDDDAPPLSSSTERSEEVRKSIDKQVRSDDGLKDEIQQLDSYLRSGKNVIPPTANEQWVTTTPSPHVRSLVRQVQRAALGFRDDSGKGLVRHRDHGRLRPMRYERTTDLDTAYDVWEPGLDQEMHIVILVDQSGSMHEAPLSNITYILDQGLDEVADVEVLTYNTTYRVLTGKNTKTKQVRVVSGSSTRPGAAMGYAYHALASSPVTNRLLILYTDGQFDSREEYDITRAYTEELKSLGVNVRFLFDARIGVRPSQFPHLKPGEMQGVPNLEALPSVVLEWTRTVLGGGG